MNLVEVLNAKRATPETVLEAMVASVGEIEGDLSVSAMRERLLAGGADSQRISQLQADLESDPAGIAEAALLWLSAASEDAASQAAVEGAIVDADRNATLIEASALTVVALYAMYLVATKGMKKKARKIEHRADGSFVETETIEYAHFSDALSGALRYMKELAVGESAAKRD